MKRLISVLALISLLAGMLCACGSEVKNDTKDDHSADTVQTKALADVYGEIKTTYDVTDMLDFSKADDLNRFYGIAADQVKDYAGGINRSGVDQEEIVMILAVDSDAAADVRAALEKRLQAKLSQTKDYNPEQYAIVEKCSVEDDGSYVWMFVSENADAMQKDFKQAVGLQ